MPEYTTYIIPSYDFSAALAFPVRERLLHCIEEAKQLVVKNGYQTLSDFPCVPINGASEAELTQFERASVLDYPKSTESF